MSVAVCIASGPSLTPEDCEAVRHLPAVVVNTSFRCAPWSATVYGMDFKWWAAHVDEVRRTCAGAKLYGWSRLVTKFGVESMESRMTGFGNSGCDAISLAIKQGAKRVILLGYDCKFTNGKTHWHGDHPAGLTNAKSLPQWPDKFKRVAAHAKRQGVEVVNASRDTALRCFDRMSLENALEIANV